MKDCSEFHNPVLSFADSDHLWIQTTLADRDYGIPGTHRPDYRRRPPSLDERQNELPVFIDVKDCPSKKIAVRTLSL